ncbi:hypothetical protein JG687_00013460 [Phytophthora cactorum]|uniref:Uncharacterized protein n=1 Tax=Phytophthora cactorum TaxID=29920 RepID=A0A329SE18_9STRA|nr:hypothetical protein Pcac1_g15722 [Phytophthora cactorum]KAG2803282.1 hypothetical protein PC111_g18747 [Phytophthora cactorum]KAG2820499.1 hypothetical protein PC112_g11744 [Phytophthora cactorum]KAG2839239.1 hypothetical protein PC113_g19513 [Phytophthora cactorum]KAG2881897.1 hypothetical protein PC114_g21331 [Phytophthora cactorum]
MSSASDISAFEHSVEPAPAETLFRDKKWTYIQDSTSNTGQYSGQIQFNLSTISSQAAFVNWEEAVIELPVKLQITVNSAITLNASCAPCTYDQLIPKADSWQWIDSCQVVIDGVAVQTNQVKENVNATFKALTEMDYNTYVKRGPTSNFVLDEYRPPVVNVPQTLDNLPTASYMNTTVGEFGLSNTFNNSGAAERSLFTGLDPTTAANNGGKLLGDIVGGSSNLQAIAKPQVYVKPVGTSGSLAVGDVLYTSFYLACVKLSDICDYFKKCPMQKNTRGFIYINYNSCTTNMTFSSQAAMSPSNVSSISST